MPGPDDIVQYATIFGMLVGSAFGLPIPEELPIVIAGAMVGKDWNVEHSGMHWWIMLPVVILGVVLCDAALYLVGRQWGARLLSSSWFQHRLLPPEKRQKIEANFHKYGIGILLVARITPGIRTPIFLMAGMLRLPFKKFLFADALYAVPGVNLLFWLSYWFTDRFMRAYQTIEANKYLVVAVVLAAVSGFLSYSFLFRRRVATGSPEDIPVVGGTVASTLSHISKPVPTENIVAVEKQIAAKSAEAAPTQKDPSVNGSPAAPAMHEDPGQSH